MSKTREEIIREYLTEEKILEFDPYADECEIKYQRIRIVKTRKPHTCMGAPDITQSRLHSMPAGTRARYETAMVDGEWGSYYTCIECIVKQLLEFPEYFPDLECLVREVANA